MRSTFKAVPIAIGVAVGMLHLPPLHSSIILAAALCVAGFLVAGTNKRVSFGTVGDTEIVITVEGKLRLGTWLVIIGIIQWMIQVILSIASKLPF